MTDPIRQDERVQRIEQAIRDSVSGHDDPLEFVFSEAGRRLFAKLASARIAVAISLRKAAADGG